MKQMTYVEALREALKEEMERDENVFILGEEVALHGGCFGITSGLLSQFGENRVIDSPLSESVIAGACVGASFMGMRPVGEIMFADDLTISMDQLINSAAKARYLYNGTNGAPMVMRAANGATGTGAGPHHSQSLEALFVHIPGFIVVMPSTPADAKGLLKSSIRCDDPVIFLEPKLCYFTKGPVPEGDHLVPLGKADVKREGKDLTVVATGAMVPKALAAAETLQKDGVSVEIVDPRTLKPLDKTTIFNSVKKTGKLVIVEEACKTASFGGHIAAIVAEEAFHHLKAPIGRVAAPDTPIPASKHLESFFIPNESKIVDAVQNIISY